MSQPLENSIATAEPPTPALESSVRAHGFPWTATWVILISTGAVVAAALVAAVHGRSGFFLATLACLVCLLAAMFDGWTRRIPNQLTYPAILLGLVANVIAPVLVKLNLHTAAVWLGAAGAASSVGGFLVCAALGIVGCLMAGVHGGDLKLLCAVGALLGLVPTANALIVALAVAIVYALLNLAFLGGLNRVIQGASMRALELVYLRRIVIPLPDETGRPMAHIPMAVPLFIGLVAAQIWQWRMGAGGAT